MLMPQKSVKCLEKYIAPKYALFVLSEFSRKRAGRILLKTRRYLKSFKYKPHTHFLWCCLQPLYSLPGKMHFNFFSSSWKNVQGMQRTSGQFWKYVLIENSMPEVFVWPSWNLFSLLTSFLWKCERCKKQAKNPCKQTQACHNLGVLEQ